VITTMTTPITVTVRYFASLADRAGVAQETLEVDPGTDLATLWETVGRRHPRLAAPSFRPLVARDMQYAEWSDTVDGVVEVAFLPPVSGG